MSAMHWTAAQYRDYQTRCALQLPLGRGVKGLDRPRRIITCALEWQEAERLIGWVNTEGLAAHPELEWLCAIPNGGWRNKTVAAKLKRQGVKPGVYDFRLAVARGGYHGLDMELKRRAGGTLSQHQKRWGEGLTMNGYLAAVCHGWQEARDRLVDYLEEKPCNSKLK